MPSKPAPRRQSGFKPIPPDVPIHAEIHLDKKLRPYIYVSINVGEQAFFILPKRGSKLDPDAEFTVSRNSPHALRKRRAPA